jgi:uncharacterized damage-inducible protein DinB
MDRVAIEDLFAFTEFSWGAYERLIRPLGDGVLTTPAPGSGWPALSDALSHMTWAHVRWLADPAGTTDEPEPRWRTWDELEAYRRRVLHHDRSYLDSLSDEELVRPREMDVDGDILAYRPAEIFAHTFLHERQHHGDVNTLLYQLGIEVPIVEFRFSLPEREVSGPS